MKITDHIWNEFIYSGHWLSIGASAIALSTMILLDFSIKFDFLIIVYIGTQCIYLFNFYKEIDYDKLDNSYRARHIQLYKKYLPKIILIYGLGYVFLLIIFGSFLSILFGILLLILGLLFTIKGKDISKKIFGFKTIYTSLSWGFLVIFTAIYCNYDLNQTVYTFSLFVFIRLLINTSFFDIKDRESDRKRKLKTLSLRLGKEKLIDFLQIVNLFSLILLLLLIFLKIFPIYTFSLSFIFFYSFYYLYKARNDKIDVYNISCVLVDGEYLYWPFLLLISILFFPM